MPRYERVIWTFAALSTCFLCAGSDVPSRPRERPVAKAYLGLPATVAGTPPRWLSSTGIFDDLRTLTPLEALLPYDLIEPFWSDGAEKRRWIAVPNEPPRRPTTIRDREQGEWRFPAGTVFVKHFEIATDEAHPEVRRRLETRILIRDAQENVHGWSYRWNEDGSDAEVLLAPQNEMLTIHARGGDRSQD